MKHRKPEYVETTEKCKYGCGNIARYITPGGHLICESSPNKCPENKRKNSDRTKESYRKNNRTSIFTEEHREKSIQARQLAAINKNFVEGSSCSNSWAKEMMIKYFGIRYACEWCGITDTYNDKPIVLHLDHINGISTDFRIENLRFLCPNCHSQTDTYCGLSNSGKIKVEDETLLDALKSCKNIRQALIKVGLSAKGLNYERCYKLIYLHGLKM